MKQFNDARQLMDEAARLPNCSTKVALLEEAARIAEGAGDLDLTFAARSQLIDAAVFSGRSDLSIVTFAWCRTQADRDPARFPVRQLLWKFKWVIGELVEFPQVSSAQLEQFLEEMEQRYRAEGYSMYSVWLSRFSNAMDAYRFDDCPRYLDELRRTSRDRMSDCVACVAGRMIEYAVVIDDWHGAIGQFEEMLAKKTTCMEEPHRSYARVLLPLVRLGRWDEAREYYKRGYPMVRRNPHLVRPHSRYITFALLNRDLAAAKRMLLRHTETALKNPNYRDRFDYLCAMTLFSLYLQLDGLEAVSLRLPEWLPVAKAKGKIAVDELAAWCYGEVRSIADQFDARNGNSYCRTRVERLPELLELRANAT